MVSTLNESQIILALQALRNNRNLSIRKAAEMYNVPRTTLTYRANGRPSRHDTSTKSKKLIESEEGAVVKRVLELAAKGFPVQIGGVKDIANRLLQTRGALCVGVNWARNFIRRQPKINTRLSRPYNY